MIGAYMHVHGMSMAGAHAARNREARQFTLHVS